MGSIIADIREELRAVPVPRDFSRRRSAATTRSSRRRSASCWLGLVLALILVYMVMACQYESLRDPFVVMFSVPHGRDRRGARRCC